MIYRQKLAEELRQHARKLVEAAESLESLDGVLPEGSRRGRKSMGMEERQVVSQRMKKFWAARREKRA